MIGAQPMAALAPLDYRCALDAAVALLGGAAPLVRCHIPALAAEVSQRFPAADGGAALLWVEPTVEHWDEDCRALASAAAEGWPLVVVLSRPLARLLPERRGWPGAAVGARPGGFRRVRRELAARGFAPAGCYGFHSLSSILLQQLSGRLERSRPALADRLHFAARLRYQVPGRWWAPATVSALVARPRHGR